MSCTNAASVADGTGRGPGDFRSRKSIYVACETGRESKWFEIIHGTVAGYHACAFEALPAEKLDKSGWRDAVRDSVKEADAVVVVLSNPIHISQVHAVACARECGKRMLQLCTHGDDCQVAGGFRGSAWRIELQSLIDSL